MIAGGEAACLICSGCLLCRKTVRGDGGGGWGSTPSLGDTNGVQMRIQEGGAARTLTSQLGKVKSWGGLVLPLGIFLIENAQISFDDFIVLTVSSV